MIMRSQMGQQAEHGDRRRWAVGVDTHTDTHSAALVDGLGEVQAQIEVTADPHGYTQLLAWAGEHLPTGQRMFWAVEGTRAHGHGLTRMLQAAGQQVIEAAPPVRASRRRGGKSDQLDAIHAARTALVNDHPATPRADGPREALRLLVTTRQHYTTTRTATINVFKSLIMGATDLREQLRHLSTPAQVRAMLAPTQPDTTALEERTRWQQLHILARTITDLDTVLATNYQQLEQLVRQLCPARRAGPHRCEKIGRIPDGGGRARRRGRSRRRVPVGTGIRRTPIEEVHRSRGQPRRSPNTLGLIFWSTNATEPLRQTPPTTPAGPDEAVWAAYDRPVRVRRRRRPVRAIVVAVFLLLRGAVGLALLLPAIGTLRQAEIDRGTIDPVATIVAFVLLAICLLELACAVFVWWGKSWARNLAVAVLTLDLVIAVVSLLLAHGASSAGAAIGAGGADIVMLVRLDHDHVHDWCR